MKKIILTLVLSLLMIFVLSALNAFAKESAEPTIAIESVVAENGEEVSVKVRIENNPGVWGMDVKISYDKEALTLLSVDNGDFYQNSEWTKGNLKGDVYILSYEAGELEDIMTTSGTLAILNFKINDSAPSGDYEIKASYNPGDIINIAFDDLNFKVINGNITVKDQSTIESTEPTIALESVVAENGEEVSIKVTVENNPGVWGMDIKISYDKEALTLMSVDNGNFYQNSEWTKGNLKGDVYILSYEAGELEDITTTSGTLATLNFKVNDSATVGDYEVKASYNPGDIINIAFDDLNFKIVNGKITVKENSVSEIENGIRHQKRINNSGGTDVRLISYVEDLKKYTSVSFTVTIDGKQSKELVCTTAYSGLYASGKLYNTEDIYGKDGYFVAFTIENFDAYLGKEIIITTTHTNVDGTKTISSRTIVME